MLLRIPEVEINIELPYCIFAFTHIFGRFLYRSPKAPELYMKSTFCLTLALFWYTCSSITAKAAEAASWKGPTHQADPAG